MRTFLCKERKVARGNVCVTLIAERVLLKNPVNGIIQNESGAVVTTVDGNKFEV